SNFKGTIGPTGDTTISYQLSIPPATPRATPEWTQLAPAGILPPPQGAPAAFDPASNRMIILGDSTTITNDVWVLTNANGLGGTPQWLVLSPIRDPVNGFPLPRSAEMVYDSVTNRFIIMGGCLGNCLPIATDLWVLTNANGLGGTPAWLKLAPTGGPPGPRV